MANMDACAYFNGKKITVMGLGLLGRGVGDVAYLASCGAELIVTDLKSKEDLASSLDALKEYPHITFVLGEHRLEDFQDRDLILKAPKTPLDSRYIEEAKKSGIPVTMSTALFARYAREQGATLVGITGTRGKTTTTELVAHLLKAGGKHVLLGGNIRGVSTLRQLPDVTKDTVAVLELDSWQLQGFREEKLSPHVAVFTTFFPDHQDYYHGMETYLDDKAQIFLYQEEVDTLVLGEQCKEEIERVYGTRIRSHMITAGAHDLRADWEFPLPGEHNRYNAALAVEVARTLLVDDETIAGALKVFPGVPGRLQLVREVAGVRFYNDTTATTPEATSVALEALGKEKNIILIMGGYDKGLDMNKLLYEIPTYVKRLIMLSGTGTSRVLPYLEGASVYDSMESAFQEAVRASTKGDIVLLSPAFASFGMFKNEYDRGDQFNELVSAL